MCIRDRCCQLLGIVPLGKHIHHALPDNSGDQPPFHPSDPGKEHAMNKLMPVVAIGVIALAGCGTKTIATPAPPPVTLPAPPTVTIAPPTVTATPQPPPVIVQPPTLVTHPPVLVNPPAAKIGGSCGNGVSVNSSTSCPFGLNVAAAFRSGDGFSGYVSAYSPTTNTTYSMYCVEGHPIVCSGGNNAVVYIAN